jgi:hypothetical protein
VPAGAAGEAESEYLFVIYKNCKKPCKGVFGLKIQEKEMHIATALDETINCRHYVPAWKGNKTSGSQPDFCLKHRVVLCGNCIKGCKEQNKESEVEESEVRNRN